MKFFYLLKMIVDLIITLALKTLIFQLNIKWLHVQLIVYIIINIFK